MPDHTNDNLPPISVNPLIISESATHVVIAIDISKIEFVRHRRFIENLFTLATQDR
jgi:hypothetical protein